MKTEHNIRKIIHVDMDAFFASVEQLDNPKYRGKPIAVGGGTQRGVVAAASYEARKYGVHSAMSNMEALKRCPDLLFVKSRFARYKEVSQKIMKLLREYTEIVEPLSIDEAFLDVTESDAYAMSIAEEIRRRIKEEYGLTASAGVSYNKFLAKTASDVNKPDGLFVITPQRAQYFIDQMSVKDFYGVGKVTAAKMRRMGIHLGADLRQLTEREMHRHFGKAGRFYYLIARGIDERPVSVERERKSVGTEQTFLTDITDREQAVYALKTIVEELWRRMAGKHFGYTITLKVKYADFKQCTRSRTYFTPLNTQQSIENATLFLWDKLSINGGVRLLGVSISKFNAPRAIEPTVRQLRLFE